MSYALEVLLTERERAQALLAEAQRRLVDLNTAIVALEPKKEEAPPLTPPGSPYHFEGAAAPFEETPVENPTFEVEGHPELGAFKSPQDAADALAAREPFAPTVPYGNGDALPEGAVEQVEIKVAAEGPVTTAVEHTEPDVVLAKPEKRTKKAKKGKKDGDLSSPLPDKIAASPFKNGDSVVVAETGELGEVVSSTPQPGGIVVHGVKFEDRSVKHLGHHKLVAAPFAAPEETPVMTAQENAGPAPWETPAEEQPVAKPKRRSNGQIAKDYGVSLIDVENWKGGGRITKADIEAFAEQQRTLEQASGDDEPTAPDSSSQATEQAFGTAPFHPDGDPAARGEEGSADDIVPAPQQDDEGYYDPASDEVDPEAEGTTYNFDKPW